MAKPPIPTHQEMRERCRSTYRHYSNISRWRLIEQYGAGDTDHVNRAAAELWEAAFLAKPEAEQDIEIDWYIPRYLGELPRPHGRQYSKLMQADPDGDHVRWHMMGYPVQTWRPKRICACALKGVGSTLDSKVADTWLHTFNTCPEHTATGQSLWDTIRGESDRFTSVLIMIGNLINSEAQAGVVLTFTSDRLADGHQRVLAVAISGVSNPQRDSVQGAADIQFGVGAVAVS